MKIAVIGNTYEDGARIDAIVKKLNENPIIEARADTAEINKIIKSGHAGWIQEVADYLLYFLDRADAVVLVAYKNQPSLAWIMGYSYKEGIPCLVYSEEEDGEFFASMLAVTTVHATLGSMECIEQYDWDELSLINVPETDHIKKRVFDEKLRES